MFEHASDATWALTQNGAILAERPLKVDAAADGGRQADTAAAAAAAKGKGKWRAPEGGVANPTEEVRCFVGNLAWEVRAASHGLSCSLHIYCRSDLGCLVCLWIATCDGLQV